MNTLKIRNRVIITEEDFNLLKDYVNLAGSADDSMSLSGELKRADVVSKAEMPRDTVRINSTVTILDLTNNRTMEFTLVMPANVDIKNNRFSILTPMGGALIGFRKNDEVEWKVPAGMKHFKILEVVNPD